MHALLPAHPLPAAAQQKDRSAKREAIIREINQTEVKIDRNVTATEENTELPKAIIERLSKLEAHKAALEERLPWKKG